MSQCNFESAVKLIPYSQEKVYARLSDLNNLSVVRDRLADPAFSAAMQQQMSEEKVNEIRKHLSNMQFDADSVRVDVAPVGNVCLRIIERTEPKCVKFEAEGAPIDMNMWIQLLPVDENECKMKITLRAELNMFIKGMVSKPLQQGVDGMADLLSRLPYGE